MASARQIAANRANSEKSTGPRTEEGKAISSMNSVTHGITPQTMVWACEEDAYRAYFESLLPDLAPGNMLELDLVRRIVYESWSLNRAAAVDHNLFANGRQEDRGSIDMEFPDDDFARKEARVFRADAKSFNLLSLYSQRLQRSYQKNLAMLRAMQKERMPSVARPPAQMAKTAVQQPLQPIEISAFAPVNGFVFSTPPADPAPPPLVTENAPSNMAA